MNRYTPITVLLGCMAIVGCGGSGSTVCEYGGMTYEPGDSFPAGDDCNTCQCDANGMVACTAAFCPPTDSGTDAAGGTDASPDGGLGVDAGGSTQCGMIICDPTTEICVESGPIGPTSAFDCVAVPPGCEGNRTCACVGATLCTGTFDSCFDSPAANTVLCECLGCQ